MSDAMCAGTTSRARVESQDRVRTPAPTARLGRLAKRTVDVVLAGAALLVLAPLVAVIAAVILVSEGRPVFFGQTRVGQHGRSFRMWKFRTMVVDAEARLAEMQARNERRGPLFKVADDPRVTRCGAFLRRSSLDELPQLWNVLNGTMSLVGPRPALPDEVAAFSPEVRRREDMPAGLTGLWQIEARHDADFESYARLDLAYIDRWSLWLDLVIMLRTPLALVRHGLGAPGGAGDGGTVGTAEAAVAAAPNAVVLDLTAGSEHRAASRSERVFAGGTAPEQVDDAELSA